MAHKHELREQRAGTVINLTSKKQEKRVDKALIAVVDRLQRELGVMLHHEREWKLASIVAHLRAHFPGVEFHYYFDTSSMRPDGGILSMQDNDGELFPILIVEVKNQGTNALRLAEGKRPQAKGNAIERLGKNVIGFRTAMIDEGIIPFVCFGDGCDFVDTSSILDRVVTIAMFGRLNEIHLMNEGPHGRFNRGSFFFRDHEWTVDEMADVMYEIARRSVHYYFAKYGEARFRNSQGRRPVDHAPSGV